MSPLLSILKQKWENKQYLSINRVDKNSEFAYYKQALSNTIDSNGGKLNDVTEVKSQKKVCTFKPSHSAKALFMCRR